MPVVVIDTSIPQAQAYLSARYNLHIDSETDQHFAVEISEYQLASEDLEKLSIRFPDVLTIQKDVQSSSLLYTGSISSFSDFCLTFSVITGHNSLPLSLAVQNYFKSRQNHPLAVPKIMGIINVTPDSFSDGGRYFRSQDAIKRAESLIREGADILDIGGESTRPGSKSVSAGEELERVLPVISSISKKYPEITVSIDTTKSSVADAALQEGASVVNDISGGTFDSLMYSVCKKHRKPLIIMHTPATPDVMQHFTTYHDVVTDIIAWLSRTAHDAIKSGVEVFAIDPGIGFGKTLKDNYTLIARLREFSSLGFPMLVGLSRKSLIGAALNLEISERDAPTMTLEFAAMLNGANIIRTHNVRNAVMAKELLKNLVSHV